ncbi:DUF3798 domain-containing protein [Anaerosphaera multitolerans]|uniref:DUF3798 domain-containing protein n=1 Tax=Anaerosphaera multitolerans TaxID=2487351 RepID=A0A437S8Z8_9FIRM|nr:DUF3798 domain-containing protein [Anaerosphaera multitolerans]RVU55595.1 DUF3798 domain-containing protein [Anaerosphaera multitolerans]
MKKLKRILSLTLILAMMFTLAACGKTDEPANSGNEAAKTEGEAEYHIGIVTGTVSQSEDELRAAEKLQEIYGDAAEGGMIAHDTYPDNFMAEQETTISKITAMAEDPLMKAIIVNQSVPGTTAAFEQIRANYPDIKLIALIPQEDPAMVGDVADIAIDADNVSRGYRIIAAAKEMGATKFVHISFPRHMSIELLALRRAIMEEACKELGVEFIAETAPDPTSDVGIPGAQQFIAENVPNWISKYGKDTAFFCTNDAHTEPLLREVAAGGAIFVEQDLPSPIMGYPGAFSIDLKEEAGDWPAINAKVEEAVIEAGGNERMGSWAYSLGYSITLGAVDLAIDAIENGTDLADRDLVVESIAKNTEGANWMATNYVDRGTGEEKPNYFLVSQDTYVYGKGYLGMDKVEVPEKYMNLNVDLDALLEAEGE